MQMDESGREGLQRQADCGLQQRRRGMETGLDCLQDQRAVMRGGAELIQMLRLKQLLA
jgi:hypothetical protein